MNCTRTAHYSGTDAWNRVRTAQIPVPDGIRPSNTVVRLGVRMELQRIVDDEPAPTPAPSARDIDWGAVVLAIMAPGKVVR